MVMIGPKSHPFANGEVWGNTRLELVVRCRVWKTPMQVRVASAFVPFAY